MCSKSSSLLRAVVAQSAQLMRALGAMAKTPKVSLPKILTDSVREQRAVVFLGAGASAEASDSEGRHPPTATQLRAELGEKFLGKPFEGYDLMSVAEMAMASHGVWTGP
jgi:phage tail tape-measure protein